MKLNQIHLQEQTAISTDIHSFVFPKWDGHEVNDVLVEPFDVLITYSADTVEDNSVPEINVVSITANEPVHLTSDLGPSIDKLAEIEDLHALVIGQRTIAQGKLKSIMPDALILDGKKIEKGTKGALQLVSYFDDHAEDDVILEGNGTGLLADIHCVTILKALLDDGQVQYRTAGFEREFTFTGRLVLLADDLESVDDGLEHRCVVIDLSKDSTFPRGTALDKIPGWSEADTEFFRKEATKNFTGHSE